MQMRVAPKIVLSEEERGELTKLSRSRRASVRLAQRARIVLLAADGMRNDEIADQLGIGRVQVSRWRGRYAKSRLAGIERDLPRGAPQVKVDVARLVELTTQSTPEAATHWSTRKMAAELGVSAASISRHWRANGLKPHLVRGFKVSRDPRFVEKLEDIVGLYMSPPEHALVLCCDEKSQVRPYAARAAAEKRACSHHDPRLQAQRHDHAVRRAQRAGRQRDRTVRTAAPSHRVAQVSAQDRPGNAEGQGAAPDRRQLRHTQASRCEWLAKHPRIHMHFTPRPPG
jgi:transposase